MIKLTAMSAKKVALFGLGGSGIVTAKSLIAGGADVIAWDDNPESVTRASKEGIYTADLRSIDWRRIDSFVLSPGVPLTHPHPHWSVDLANSAGVEIIGDVELFCRQLRFATSSAKLVAITGTNGKSTTTALLTHILNEAGCDVQMGGNIGVPVLLLEEPVDDRIFVVECSSYQIDLAPSLGPDVGILLNLAPDHLDRHGTMEHYASIKERLVAKAGLAIVGVGDKWSAAIAARLPDAVPVDVVKDGQLLDLEDAPSLRGAHNVQNALAATTAGRALGLSPEKMMAALKTFGGLAHRMQIVATHGKVKFINDSKATNADAAAKSLSSFDPIFWIAGGLAKEGGIEALRPLFGRVAKAYLVGEAAPAFAATLGEDVPYEISATMDVAVVHAARDAAQSEFDEPVVLLAPAAASFDQYQNFEKRGDAFVAAAQSLPVQLGENA
ncbi:MAG: UDP-N-acetylmuramoyl-L-alanine--D-glutamate ligase [Pseudomonadota bacterium]